MRYRSKLLLVVLVVATSFGVGAAAQDAPPQPPWEEMVELYNTAEWRPARDPAGWEGLRSGGVHGSAAAIEAEAAPSAQSAIVSNLKTLVDPDGCGEVAAGVADIEDVTVDLQADGNIRFTVNLCSAHDMRDETGWDIHIGTRLTTNFTADQAVLTHQADLTHEIEYCNRVFPQTCFYEPDASVDLNDEAAVFVLPPPGPTIWLSGRPDGPTLHCAKQINPAFSGDPDRVYTGGVATATAWSIDLAPACWGHHSTFWAQVRAPGDSAAGSLTDGLIHNSNLSSGRVAGDDRFETAARISRRAYPTGGKYLFGDRGSVRTSGGAAPGAFGTGSTLVVYIADGFGFPDSLGGSGFMAMDEPMLAGPILLVNSILDTVPDATLGEVCRIQPSQIVVLGGTGVVSNSQLAAIETAARASDCSVYGI